MTTGDVATYANLDGIKGAVSSANIQFVLRNKLVYEFLYDIGYPSWCRAFFDAPLASGNNYFDLPSNDFRQMRKLVVYVSSTEKPELTYIGDQDEKVFDAQAETTAGQPSEFWIGFDGTTLRRVFVNRPADQNYTMRGTYYKRIPFGSRAAIRFPPRFQLWRWFLTRRLSWRHYRKSRRLRYGRSEQVQKLG